jgi:phage-related protein
MTRKRRIIYHGHYFEGFIMSLPEKPRNKIAETIKHMQDFQRVSTNNLKHIEGTYGLYEIRVKLGSDCWRIFCFFSKQNALVILNGFQKKTNKTPKSEIKKALKLKYEYERRG